MQHALFEVSWEVCNKVGGIHTVVSTKAKTLTARYGDDYVALGPWLMHGEQRDPPFEESAGFEDFSEACREMGIPVRVGRWAIPGRPRTILVEFSSLFENKDAILSALWERHNVDSLHGGYDYTEPVLFGHACGLVIEKWVAENVAPYRGRAVAHFHEWMTASGMLHLQENAPHIGTVFTTHATMLGRAVSSTGQSPQDGLMGREPEELAESMGVTAKHSLEGIAARSADVFTTVSEVTADEAAVFHHRQADPILPNGIDLDVMDELAGDHPPADVAARLRDLTRRLTLDDVSDAKLFAISGRYEFHNKGIDLFLDSLAKLNGRDGSKIVAFVLVPAGNSGIKGEMRDRFELPIDEIDGAPGISTHNLFDKDSDPVHVHCRKLGLTNERGSRVKVVQIPIYLSEGDGFLDLPYEAVLRAMDLTCFPSFYEPWGYTPEESLAVGVPTITSDYAGFGRWVRAANLGPENGVHVLSRVGVEATEVELGLEDILESFVGAEHDRAELAKTCRRTAQRTAWADLIQNYYQAYEQALAIARERSGDAADARAWRRRMVEVKPSPGDGAGPRLHRFSVSATLPDPLQGLEKLAHNYWWSWDHDAMSLFEELSAVRWEACDHNPITFLRDVFPEDLAAKAKDDDYCRRVQGAVSRLDSYLAAKDEGGSAVTWDHPVAYFSAEFSIHESLPIYSGGLGVLAGDHLKSASDINLPLVGVGLFYRHGYFKQQLTASGDQVSVVSVNDPTRMPIEQVVDDSGRPLEIVLQLPSSRLALRAWRVDVGRVPLYLLDSDVESNRPEDRTVTQALYGGDHENRLRQEIVLGRGGVKLLRELGIEPGVYHCNEGHAAFLSLERVRTMIRDEGLTFDEAQEVCRATTVFTTHTPVPAGHDRFGEDLVRRYFSDAPSWVGVPWERFFALGQAEPGEGAFNMTYLAMNFANFVNGVSRLHGQVSQGLLHEYWSHLLASEVPVGYVTNGVHLPTWTGTELSAALRSGDEPLRSQDFADRSAAIGAAVLWDIENAGRRRLVDHLRTRLEKNFRARNDSPAVLSRVLRGLDDEALTIGFARRFAPYKRAHLMFFDEERLARILDDADRPMRILIAGKAHPNDKLGQDILRRVAQLARSDRFIGKVFMLENYDVDLARFLVEGVDVWLNTPTRPLEASGTSGMKVAANGGLNLSILDGWWIEAADGTNGWSIGAERMYDDQGLQDELDATTLYRLLEDEVKPLFYDREGGIPVGWIERVKRSLATIPTFFNTDRMVGEYAERAYEKLAANFDNLTAGRYAAARELAQKHDRIRRGFEGVRVRAIRVGDLSGLRIGDPVEVAVDVDLGSLGDDDVVVELVLGHTRDEHDLHNMVTVPLKARTQANGSVRTYEGSYRMERCGSFSHGARIRAREDSPLDQPLRDLVLWA